MQTGGITAGLAGRYASALFELAGERGRVAEVGASLAVVRDELAAGGDLARLAASPVVSRADAGRAVLAAAGAMALDPLARDFLGVLARARRLRSLPVIIEGYMALSARARGETRAEVTSARPLADEQVAALRDVLKRRLRAEIDLSLRVDPAILGGLVVRVGSRLIDSSIKTKLAAVGAAMRG